MSKLAEITEIVAKEKRLKLIRQDRFEVHSYECYLRIDDNKVSVTNISPFGLAVETKHPLPIEKNDISLFFEGYEIATIHIKAVRQEAQIDGVMRAAYEVMGEPIHIDNIKAIIEAKNVVNSLSSTLAENSELPENFKLLTYEIKRVIDICKAKIDSVEQALVNTNASEIKDFEDTFTHVVADYLTDSLGEFYKKLSKSLIGCDSNIVKRAFEFFRTEIGRSVFEAPFANRVYYKPLGYAGDYEMMNIIYRRAPEGKNLYAKCLHKYFIEKPAAAAVRNRAEFLEKKFFQVLANNKSKKTIKILSVASGPTFEVQNFLKKLKSLDFKIEFHLLDQDEASLKHAQRKLYELNNFKNKISFYFHNISIKHVIVKGLPMVGFDLIYSAGLFDYFSDPVAQMAGLKLHEGLIEGGELVIGNFNVNNPNQFEMDIALDWQLIYRSAEEMKKLFQHLDKNIYIETEPLNINLFLIAKK